MKLKIVPIANKVNEQTFATALYRFLDELKDEISYKMIQGGKVYDYNERDFDGIDEDALTIVLKVKNKHG